MRACERAAAKEEAAELRGVGEDVSAVPTYVIRQPAYVIRQPAYVKLQPAYGIRHPAYGIRQRAYVIWNSEASGKTYRPYPVIPSADTSAYVSIRQQTSE